jgi:hypothetical protein
MEGHLENRLGRLLRGEFRQQLTGATGTSPIVCSPSGKSFFFRRHSRVHGCAVLDERNA